jgi:hypothetical protein
MATLDFTGDAVAGAPAPNETVQKVKPACLHRQFKVADIIAADATMTTNGYIAADDIIQLLHVPAGFVAEAAVLRVITAGTASVTFEVGLAGGAELLGSTPLAADATAGTCYKTIEADSYDLGHVFTANDTIDFQPGTANLATGEFELFVFGKQLVLGSAT